MSRVITDPAAQKLLLGAVALGVVMDGIDGSVVNVALPAMATDFGTDTGTIAWVIITYLLMMAGLLLVFGKIADRGFIRRVFLAGFVIFTLGSVACGIAPSLEVLLAARLVQGAGASMIAAVAPLICVRYLPAPMLGMALGVITATASIGFAAGPAIGGILTQALSWHWIFLINIPIGIFGTLFAARVIPPDMREGVTARSFDRTGALLLFSAMVLLTFALIEVAARGLSDPVILACSALCLLCITLFAERELRVPEPFVNIRIFAAGKFSAILTALLIINAVFMGIFYLLPFYLVTETGADLTTSGLYLLVPPLVIALVSVPFGRWSDLHGRRVFTIAASLGIVLAGVIFAILSAELGVFTLLAGLIVLGLAYGIAAGPFGGRVIECAPKGEMGTASSLMVTAIYFGGVLGTAIYAAFFTFVTAGGGEIVAFADLDPAAFLHAFHLTMAAGGIIAVSAVVLTAMVPEQKERT